MQLVPSKVLKDLIKRTKHDQILKRFLFSTEEGKVHISEQSPLSWPKWQSWCYAFLLSRIRISLETCTCDIGFAQYVLFLHVIGRLLWNGVYLMHTLKQRLRILLSTDQNKVQDSILVSNYCQGTNMGMKFGDDRCRSWWVLTIQQFILNFGQFGGWPPKTQEKCASLKREKLSQKGREFVCICLH